MWRGMETPLKIFMKNSKSFWNVEDVPKILKNRRLTYRKGSLPVDFLMEKMGWDALVDKQGVIDNDKW